MAPAAPVPQPGHCLGERGRTPGVTAGPRRGGGPRHVTPPPGAAGSAPARAPVHAVVAQPGAAQSGMRRAARPEVPPLAQEASAGGLRPGARDGSVQTLLLGAKAQARVQSSGLLRGQRGN